MRLYVYRVNEREYGAGLGREECEKLGSIVEQWPLNTLEEAKFLAKHGTSFGTATHQVSKIADLVHELMTIDPTFKWSEPARFSIRTPTVIAPEPEARPSLFQRIKSWCYAR